MSVTAGFVPVHAPPRNDPRLTALCASAKSGRPAPVPSSKETRP
jgi:hypothetical protein